MPQLRIRRLRISNWSEAAATIQDAINAAAPGDIVLVNDGVYATGGKAMASTLTNRVALDKALVVTSVNGYASTIIQGAAAWHQRAECGALRVAHERRDPGRFHPPGRCDTGIPLELGAGPELRWGRVVRDQTPPWWRIASSGVIRPPTWAVRSTAARSIIVQSISMSPRLPTGALIGGTVYSAAVNNCTVAFNSVIGCILVIPISTMGICRRAVHLHRKEQHYLGEFCAAIIPTATWGARPIAIRRPAAATTSMPIRSL